MPEMREIMANFFGGGNGGSQQQKDVKNPEQFSEHERSGKIGQP